MNWIIAAVGFAALAIVIVYNLDDLLTFDSKMKRSKW